MGFTAATIFGGFPDPEESDALNAVNERMPFADRITINLLPDVGETNYPSIQNITTTVSLFGVPITLQELTNNQVSINVEYNTPQVNTNLGITVVTSFTSSEGNVYITGNVVGAFSDSFWQYKNLTTRETNTVIDPFLIPGGDIGLFTYKPSFMRYTNILFTVNVTYGGGFNSVYNIRKKITNDWEINRLALIAQINTEQTYRSNNYPK